MCWFVSYCYSNWLPKRWYKTFLFVKTTYYENVVIKNTNTWLQYFITFTYIYNFLQFWGTIFRKIHPTQVFSCRYSWFAYTQTRLLIIMGNEQIIDTFSYLSIFIEGTVIRLKNWYIVKHNKTQLSLYKEDFIRRTTNFYTIIRR